MATKTESTGKFGEIAELDEAELFHANQFKPHQCDLTPPTKEAREKNLPDRTTWVCGATYQQRVTRNSQTVVGAQEVVVESVICKAKFRLLRQPGLRQEINEATGGPFAALEKDTIICWVRMA